MSQILWASTVCNQDSFTFSLLFIQAYARRADNLTAIYEPTV
jgi:hypothetical protein